MARTHGYVALAFALVTAALGGCATPRIVSPTAAATAHRALDAPAVVRRAESPRPEAADRGDVSLPGVSLRRHIADGRVGPSQLAPASPAPRPLLAPVGPAAETEAAVDPVGEAFGRLPQGYVWSPDLFVPSGGSVRLGRVLGATLSGPGRSTRRSGERASGSAPPSAAAGTHRPRSAWPRPAIPAMARSPSSSG